GIPEEHFQHLSLRWPDIGAIPKTKSVRNRTRKVQSRKEEPIVHRLSCVLCDKNRTWCRSIGYILHAPLNRVAVQIIPYKTLWHSVNCSSIKILHIRNFIITTNRCRGDRITIDGTARSDSAHPMPILSHRRQSGHCK